MAMSVNLEQGSAPAFPVSVKAVVLFDNQVVLLKNEREEWELPGGKLELGEDPRECVVREVSEELGLAISLGRILDSWQYHIGANRDVVIVTYGAVCTTHTVVMSHEHKEVGWFQVKDVKDLKMPEGYKRSIADWAATSQS